MSPKVFISYSHEDSDWTQEFASSLRDKDVEVWLDVWAINPGESLQDALEAGLRQSDAIVAIVTPANVDNPNTYFELGVALGLGKRLILIIDEALQSSAIHFNLRIGRYLSKRSPTEAASQVAQALAWVPS